MPQGRSGGAGLVALLGGGDLGGVQAQSRKLLPGEVEAELVLEMRRPRALEGASEVAWEATSFLLPREIDALKLCLDLRREVLALGVGHLAAVEDGDDLPLAHPVTETLAHLGHRADHPHRHPGHPVGIGRHRAGDEDVPGEHAALRRRHRDRLGGDLLRGHPHVDLVPVFVVVVRFSLRGVSALFGRRRDGQAGGREAGANAVGDGGKPGARDEAGPHEGGC